VLLAVFRAKQLVGLFSFLVNKRPKIFHSFFACFANHLFYGRFLRWQILVGNDEIRKHNNYSFLFD